MPVSRCQIDSVGTDGVGLDDLRRAVETLQKMRPRLRQIRHVLTGGGCHRGLGNREGQPGHRLLWVGHISSAPRVDALSENGVFGYEGLSHTVARIVNVGCLRAGWGT